MVIQWQDLMEQNLHDCLVSIDQRFFPFLFSSIYQIVLETLSGTQAGMTKRSPSENTPCDLPPSELGSYSQARSTGHSCYITAEIADVNRETEFVVGDNKTYGGYYNAPLKKGQTYDVWVGLVVTVDGVSCRDYFADRTACTFTN